MFETTFNANKGFLLSKWNWKVHSSFSRQRCIRKLENVCKSIVNRLRQTESEKNNTKRIPKKNRKCFFHRIFHNGLITDAAEKKMQISSTVNRFLLFFSDKGRGEGAAIFLIFTRIYTFDEENFRRCLRVENSLPYYRSQSPGNIHSTRIKFVFEQMKGGWRVAALEK